MNIRLVIKLLGLVLVVLAASMALSELVVLLLRLIGEAPRGAVAEEHARTGLIVAATLGLLVGGAMWLLTRRTEANLGRREALLLVAASWLLGAALSAVPFLLWATFSAASPDEHPFRNFVNCYFEAMSGLTTTGATVLTDIEAVPPSLLFWRALTHWLGGLGIVLLFVAVLPSLGVGGKRLFRVEAPGPEPEGVRPHMHDTARVLWFIYLGLTVAQLLLLKLVGSMSFYDAFCHTFATLATGGFSTENASVGAYNRLAVDTIIIVFMVLAGANFGLYFQLIRRRFKSVLGDIELRVYVIVLALATLLVIIAVSASGGETILLTTGEDVPATAGNTIRQGVFTTVSIQTTTGFCTADFEAWPLLAKAVLVLLMFVGGCAGSTAGGIKIIRIWIVFKVMLSELERAFRPNVVRPVRIGGTVVDSEMRLAALAYVLGIIVLFVIGAGLIMLFEQVFGTGTDFATAGSASVATLCTIGPGLANVGATDNYAWFSMPAKGVMCVLMTLGRLEVFAIIVLFSPRFWRGD